MNILPRDPNISTPLNIQPYLGTWILLSSITDGKDASEAEIQNVRVAIADGRETVWVKDQVVAQDIPFYIDFSVEPNQTTDYLPDGQLIKGITKVEGDILTSCVATIGQERPKAFTSADGSGHTLRVFKRLGT